MSKLAFSLSDVPLDALLTLSAVSVLVPTKTPLPALYSMAALFSPIQPRNVRETNPFQVYGPEKRWIPNAGACCHPKQSLNGEIKKSLLSVLL